VISFRRRDHEIRFERGDLLDVRLHAADFLQRARGGGEVRVVIGADDLRS
jgi:hypothetical protein